MKNKLNRIYTTFIILVIGLTIFSCGDTHIEPKDDSPVITLKDLVRISRMMDLSEISALIIQEKYKNSIRATLHHTLNSKADKTRKVIGIHAKHLIT